MTKYFSWHGLTTLDLTGDFKGETEQYSNDKFDLLWYPNQGSVCGKTCDELMERILDCEFFICLNQSLGII